MANTFTVIFKDKTKSPLSYKLCLKEIRTNILNALFRNYSICYPRGSLKILSTLPLQKIITLSEEVSISQPLISNIITKTLRNLYYFSSFLKTYKFPWEHRKPLLYNKLKIYLHKIYKIAPLFNYNRAKINLNSLHIFFTKANFWPTISTQLALTLYITDLNDSHFKNKILIENIRAITNCSAYAFYRTKNKMIETGVLNRNERDSRNI
jgi:hypothetical protein